MTIRELFTDDYNARTFKADIWQEDNHGISHRRLCNYGMSVFYTLRPEFIPEKHKNKLLKSMRIQLDANENITCLDAVYGKPYTETGYIIRHIFDFFGNEKVFDVTRVYRASR